MNAVGVNDSESFDYMECSKSADFARPVHELETHTEIAQVCRLIEIAIVTL